MNGELVMDFKSTCGNCKFFLRTIGRPSEGLCRRYPPNVVVASCDTPNGVQMAPVAVMPNMGENNWCGEWKGRILE